MSQNNYYEGIKHIVHIKTEERKTFEICELCNSNFNKFSESVNHYINTHGYKILHIGQETSHDREGNPFQLTVALLGK